MQQTDRNISRNEAYRRKLPNSNEFRLLSPNWLVPFCFGLWITGETEDQQWSVDIQMILRDFMSRYAKLVTLTVSPLTSLCPTSCALIDSYEDVRSRSSTISACSGFQIFLIDRRITHVKFINLSELYDRPGHKRLLRNLWLIRRLLTVSCITLEYHFICGGFFLGGHHTSDLHLYLMLLCRYG